MINDIACADIANASVLFIKYLRAVRNYFHNFTHTGYVNYGFYLKLLTISSKIG